MFEDAYEALPVLDPKDYETYETAGGALLELAPQKYMNADGVSQKGLSVSRPSSLSGSRETLYKNDEGEIEDENNLYNNDASTHSLHAQEKNGNPYNNDNTSENLYDDYGSIDGLVRSTNDSEIYEMVDNKTAGKPKATEVGFKGRSFSFASSFRRRKNSVKPVSVAKGATRLSQDFLTKSGDGENISRPCKSSSKASATFINAANIYDNDAAEPERKDGEDCYEELPDMNIYQLCEDGRTSNSKACGTDVYMSPVDGENAKHATPNLAKKLLKLTTSATSGSSVSKSREAIGGRSDVELLCNDNDDGEYLTPSLVGTPSPDVQIGRMSKAEKRTSPSGGDVYMQPNEATDDSYIYGNDSDWYIKLSFPFCESV